VLNFHIKVNFSKEKKCNVSPFIEALDQGSSYELWPTIRVFDENCFSDIDNFTMTQENYPKASNGS